MPWIRSGGGPAAERPGAPGRPRSATRGAGSPTPRAACCSSTASTWSNKTAPYTPGVRRVLGRRRRVARRQRLPRRARRHPRDGADADAGRRRHGLRPADRRDRARPREHDVYSLIDFHQDGWGPLVGSDGFPAWMTLTGDAANDTDAGFPLYYQQNPALQQAFQSFWDDADGPGDAGLQDDYAAMFCARSRSSSPASRTSSATTCSTSRGPARPGAPCLNDRGRLPLARHRRARPRLREGRRGDPRARATTHLVFGEPFVLFNFGVVDDEHPGARRRPERGHGLPRLPAARPNQAPDVIDNAVAWSSSHRRRAAQHRVGRDDEPADAHPRVRSRSTRRSCRGSSGRSAASSSRRCRTAPGGSNLVGVDGERPRAAVSAGRRRDAADSSRSTRRRRRCRSPGRRRRAGGGDVRDRHGDDLRDARAHLPGRLRGHGDERLDHLGAVRTAAHGRRDAGRDHGDGRRAAGRELPVVR